MKIKKSLGTVFLEAMIDVRELDPVHFSDEVESFLDANDVKFTRASSSEFYTKYQLIYDFFGHGEVFTINPHVSGPLLIGKGVCFDTGGYDLKTNMEGMFYDKNGALLAIAAAIDSGFEAQVFFVNNTIHSHAPVTGQILTEAHSKHQVLIDNTDAEGRIGLANLIALNSKTPRKIITMATLTGAASYFTSDRTFALVHSTDDKVLEKVLRASLVRGFELWPAPKHKSYDAAVKTKVKGATIRSCGKLKGAGSQTAFSFLKSFAKPKKASYTHVDMAAMSTDKDGNGLVWGLDEIQFLLGAI